MPAKRVSLKGQGADLFFGGSRPIQTEEQLPGQVTTDMPPTASGAIPPAPAAAHLGGDEPPADEAAPLPEAESEPNTSGDTDVARESSSYRASVLASNDDGIEAIRRVVKQTGREVSFVRLSAEEKGRLADIVYSYRRQGRKTTENELNRIAINALLEDYDAHGTQSVLARVLDALHA